MLKFLGGVFFDGKFDLVSVLLEIVKKFDVVKWEIVLRE